MASLKGQYLRLLTGSMPMVGLGCFFGLGTKKDSNIQQWIETAIDAGYRGFDTAFIYRTEKPLGRAVRAKIATGVINRDEVFITSKLSWDRHHPDDVRGGFEESLSNLSLDYVDQYLMHWPHANTKEENVETFMKKFVAGQTTLYKENDYLKVWKIMEECVKDGLVKSIGLSNFNVSQVQNILDHCSIKPAVNQCEIHPYYQNLELTKYCESKGVAMVAYTPLGNVHPDVQWNDTETAEYEETTLRGPDDWESPLKDPVILDLAQKYSKTAGQIALRFTVQRGIPVIPSSKSPQRQTENLQVFDFELSSDDMDKLYKLERKQKFWIVPMMSAHKDYPFPELV